MIAQKENFMSADLRKTAAPTGAMNQTYKTINTRLNMGVADPDEQFILDVIRVAKQESIIELIDQLRLQESKSTMLIRFLERYRFQLENREVFKTTNPEYTSKNIKEEMSTNKFSTIRSMKKTS